MNPPSQEPSGRDAAQAIVKYSYEHPRNTESDVLDAFYNQEHLIDDLKRALEREAASQPVPETELRQQKVPCDVCGGNIREFQDEVRHLVLKLSGAPDSAIDGAGSDAGWEEFTLCEIQQAFRWMSEHASAPGRWVQCSEREPIMDGDYDVQQSDGSMRKRTYSLANQEWKCGITIHCWFEPAPIPNPPPVESEDEKAWKSAGIFMSQKEAFMAGRRSKV